MSPSITLALFCLPAISAFTAGVGTAPVARACAVRMLDEPKTVQTTVDPNAFNKLVPVTRSREVGSDRTGSIVVTDGSGSFYQSRSVFNMLNDFGRYKSIVACSDSVVDAKKMLISRQGRYSGLLDVLSFHEGAPATAFANIETWLAINPDEAALKEQIDAAAAAGVRRIFLLVSDALTDAVAIDAQLKASSMAYTVMRTGPLIASQAEGTALKISDLEMPVCEDVPRDDVFRFVTEALSLEEAHARGFSLCPTENEGVVSTLKQMRMVGYDRRDEIQFLLSGKVAETFDAAEVSEEEAKVQEELVLRSEAELAAEREEELKMLLGRARQRGIDTQERLAFEEKEKLAHRKEQEKYYKAPLPEDGKPTASGDEGPADDTPEKPPQA